MQENFYEHFASWGTHKTPKRVKNLITTLIITSILSPILTFFLHHFGYIGPQDFLPLSLSFLQKYYFFEWITYPLVYSLETSISMSMLLTLTLQMSLLWFVSSELVRLCGQKKFLWLFFSSILFIGLISSLVLFLTKSTMVLYGIVPPLLALFTLWVMYKKEESLTLFLFLKIKAQTIAFSLFAVVLFMNLTAGAYLHLFANLMAIFYGALFGHFVAKIALPWPLRKRAAPTKKKRSADIIDITSASNDPDDLFMDQMLDKIAQVGRDGLTRAERARMDEIVKRRRPPTE